MFILCHGVLVRRIPIPYLPWPSDSWPPNKVHSQIRPNCFTYPMDGYKFGQGQSEATDTEGVQGFEMDGSRRQAHENDGPQLSGAFGGTCPLATSDHERPKHIQGCVSEWGSTGQSIKRQVGH